LLSVRGSQILSALQESPRSQSAGRARVGLRKSILAAEVGLTVVLLIGAGLLVKSYQRLRSTDLGCVTDNLLTMRFSLPEVKYSRPAQRVEFLETLLERVRALPGVQYAGLGRMLPGEGYGGDMGFAIAEHPPLPAGHAQYAIVRWVDPGYFTTLGIPLLRGRTFDESRRLEKADEIVINQSFARQYFPGEDPLGKHLVTFGKKSFTIAGVIGDTRYAPAEATAPIMHISVYNFGPPPETLVVRSSRDVTSLALPIQRIVQKLDPELAVADILTMDQVLGKSTIDASFDATLLLAFAVLSLALAAVGLFGVTAYVVAQRTSEIGIRMAMGAQSSDVLRLVLGQGMVPALAGLGLGVVGALELTRFLSSLLYSVKPSDPLTFVAVCLLLTGVALFASYIPARRAMRVDPAIALRHE
jgi:predicted permease